MMENKLKYLREEVLPLVKTRTKIISLVGLVIILTICCSRERTPYYYKSILYGGDVFLADSVEITERMADKTKIEDGFWEIGQIGKTPYVKGYKSKGESVGLWTYKAGKEEVTIEWGTYDESGLTINRPNGWETYSNLPDSNVIHVSFKQVNDTLKGIYKPDFFSISSYSASINEDVRKEIKRRVSNGGRSIFKSVLVRDNKLSNTYFYSYNLQTKNVLGFLCEKEGRFYEFQYKYSSYPYWAAEFVFWQMIEGCKVNNQFILQCVDVPT